MGATGKTVPGLGFVAAVAVAVGVATAGDEPAVKAAAVKEAGQKGAEFSGTFTDTTVHKGTLQCQVTQGEGEKWTLKFNGKNEGQGPNRPYECTFDLPGKKDGATLTLSGTNDLGRVGQHEVTVVVTDKTLEGKFKRTDGKNSGTFSMTATK